MSDAVTATEGNRPIGTEAILNGWPSLLRLMPVTSRTKIMAIPDRQGLPVAVHLESATPHDVTLVHATLAQRFVSQLPVRLIGDNAYESDRLDAELARRGVELIAPHRRTRTQRTQDGRPLRRYQRRWKVERLFAWFQNFRRIVVL